MKIRILTYCIWLVAVIFIFNKYAYQIDQHNSSIRLLLTRGITAARSFDENGLPQSHSPRLGTFISPFYVVHYGLIYSDGLHSNGLHWRTDPTLDYWNIPPPQLSYDKKIEWSKNAADWVIANLQLYEGRYHLLYNFSWPYTGYSNDSLQPPWWSGLTDGYAIILMLRAYDIFESPKYLHAAHKLYKSVISPISEGGSLNTLNGCPWIEEYVDPSVSGSKMSFVFNGMIYATYGVDSYNQFFGRRNKLTQELYSCIEHNASLFDLNGWSYYDAIGNSANIKYHIINYQLLADLINTNKINKSPDISLISKSWRLGATMPALYYTLKGPRSISYFQFVLELIFSTLFPIIVYGMQRIWKKTKNNI